MKCIKYPDMRETEKTTVPYDTISNRSVSTESMFNKCCFCVPLRTGCFVLGYLNLTISCLQTLALVVLIAFIGIASHGFDHFGTTTARPNFLDSTDTPFIEGSDQMVLNKIKFILIAVLIANLAWIAIHIACLVGLHKKKPGHIRVYIGFATARLVLSFAVFVYVLMTKTPKATTIFTHSIDLGLTAYFILVYYIYAVKLEKEREAELTQPAPINNIIMYPSKLDKSHLVA